MDCAMLDGQVALLTYLASAVLNAGVTPPRMGNRHLSVAPYSAFAGSDGYFNLAAANDALWTKLCTLIERPDLLEDARFTGNPERVQNVVALEQELAPVFAQRPVAEWIERLDGAGIPAGPILRVDQVLAHPQLAARDMVVSLPHPTLGQVHMTGVPIRLSETPGQVRLPPPGLGEHSEQILSELGYSGPQIAELRASGAAGV